MCGQRGKELLRCRMHAEKMFEDQIVDEHVKRRRVGTVHAQGPWEVRRVGADAPTLDRPRVSDEIEVGVGLPALAGEPGAPVLGRDVRVGTGIRVREHRIGVFVHRDIGAWGAARGRRGPSTTRLRVAATTGNRNCDEKRREC